MRLVLPFLFLLFGTLLAQSPTFQQLYGEELGEIGIDIALTENEGFIAVGNSVSFGPTGHSFYLVRLNIFGDTLWTRTWGGLYLDQAKSISTTSDGGFLVTGILGKYDVQGQGFSDAYFGKIGGEGTLNWELTISGQWSNSAQSSLEDREGNYLFAGALTITDNSSTPTGFLAKVNSGGDLLWRKDYGGFSLINAVIESDEGGYLLAGRLNPGPGSSPLLIKTDREGDTIWTKTSNWGIDFGMIHDLIATQDGNYIVAGSQYSQGNQDGFAAKISPTGALIWSRTFGGSEDDRLTSISEFPNGDFAGTGVTFSNTPPPFTNSDVWFLLLNSNGDIIWTKNIGGGGNEEGHGVAVTADGGIVLTGGIASQLFIMKTDGNGDLIPGGQSGAEVYITSDAFAAQIRIHYDTDGVKVADIRLYDVAGRLVRNLPTQVPGPGLHIQDIDMRGMAAGIYILRMQIGTHTVVRKVLWAMP